MKEKTEETLLLGLEEAGRRLGLTAATVRYLADVGEIHCLRDSARRRLFFADDIERLRQRRKLGIRARKG